MTNKRIISIVMIFAIILSVVCVPTYAATEKHPDLLIGDADGDGVVTIMDATEISMHMAKKIVLDEIRLQCAKTDFTTEELSVIDATIIQQKAAGIDNNETREVGQAAFIYVNGEYTPALEEYQRYLEKLMSIHGFSGVAYASRNGRVLCQAAQGMQNTEKNIEMSVDTLFPIGSVSKQFCATAVLILRDQGKLSVDDTIDKYFPDYKYGSQITIHQLLCMRSGIPDYANDNPNMEDIFVYEKGEDNLNSLLKWTYEQDLFFEPGAQHRYSNTNYFLLSLIVEKVSSTDYYDFVEKNIFEPLSMENTAFYDEIVGDERIAEMVLPDGIEIIWPEGWSQGDGDIVSNAHDMDLWLTAMGDGVLLSDESYKMMTTDYHGSRYGYGILVDKHQKYSHTGHVPTYVTDTETFANENINIFVASNESLSSSTNNFENLANQLSAKIR